jgi:hypothetical protein
MTLRIAWIPVIAAACVGGCATQGSNAERATGEKKYDDARRYAQSATADADAESPRN